MTLAYFLHVDGPDGQHEELQTWADRIYGPALSADGNANRIEAYSPQSADDPYLGRESGKLLIVQGDFSDLNQLEGTLANPSVSKALAMIPKNRDFKVTSEAFEVRHFPLLDGSIRERKAPISFVVRYYRPINNQQAFNNHYVDHHPPIMAHFPRIRNILCYSPVKWSDPNPVAPSNSFLGNELVFDSINDLNAALSSDVRHDLRADYRQFPAHEGKVTHHAMRRRVLFSADGH